MVQPRWEGFGIRLGRAIDRWPGGGQRAFTAALEAYAAQNELGIPTSYRTLLNYLSEKTQPSTAWVDAAAAVLRWNPENLLTGKGEERPNGYETGGTKMLATATAAPRMVALVELFVNEYVDLPMPARQMIFNFLDDYFAGHDADWSDVSAREPEVNRVLNEFFRPLLTRHTMNRADTMALASTLTAAAYVRFGSGSTINKEEE